MTVKISRKAAWTQRKRDSNIQAVVFIEASKHFQSAPGLKRRLWDEPAKALWVMRIQESVMGMAFLTKT